MCVSVETKWIPNVLFRLLGEREGRERTGGREGERHADRLREVSISTFFIIIYHTAVAKYLPYQDIAVGINATIHVSLSEMLVSVEGAITHHLYKPSHANSIDTALT